MPFGVGYFVKAWLGDLLDERRAQIARGNQQLRSLGELRRGCPNTVIDFLLMTHALNQCRTEALGDVGPMDVRAALVAHLGQIEREMDRMDAVLESVKPCEELMILIQSVAVTRE